VDSTTGNAYVIGSHSRYNLSIAQVNTETSELTELLYFPVIFANLFADTSATFDSHNNMVWVQGSCAYENGCLYGIDVEERTYVIVKNTAIMEFYFFDPNNNWLTGIGISYDNVTNTLERNVVIFDYAKYAFQVLYSMPLLPPISYGQAVTFDQSSRNIYGLFFNNPSFIVLATINVDLVGYYNFVESQVTPTMLISTSDELKR